MSGDGSDDPVTAFCRIARDEAGISSACEEAGISSGLILRIEQRIRREFGGQRPYIAKSSPADRAESLRLRDRKRR